MRAFVLMVVLTVACGSSDAPARPPTASTAPSATSTPAPSVTPTPAAPPATSPSPSAPPVASYRVVARYPHDPQAFTQGLVYHEGHLFEGTGLEGRSSLREVELETGRVLRRVDLPARYFGEGITLLGDRIWQLTWRSRVGFVYDLATLKQVGRFEYPTEGWGLTTDGERLIMSDGSATLRFRDPATFRELGRVDVRDERGPVRWLNELEWVEGEVWANVWQTDRIARIDPATGRVVGWLDLTGLLSAADRAGREVDVLNGIAYDAAGGRLFVTGKLWPVLYEIEVVEPH